ncbi:magnesium and cobalt transport protein CorA [Dokdonella koreensis]|uniref:Magnesium Mg(2+) and cobalt Co(2+) transport protein CorA n=1 Tax=Dokdonella koreensis DS-123 TaxID=1300342 RepID=A0A160DX20_9GAMM|nr:magnesium and cobalt transport protein CorA [Dokdonella koreensis]ANB19227.1 Magnesium Mg(2+) and cobalt Co(2+) transport protein CorA [Dokdonella koreensis DS-123]
MAEAPAPVTAEAPRPQTPMVVNCVAYSNQGRRVGDITIDEISDVLERPDQFVWVGLHEPDAQLLDKLQEEFGLHDLAIEDANNAHQRPKIESYGDSLFIVAQTAQFVSGRIEFGETHVFLGRNYIVTIRHGASLSYAPARRGCEQTPDLLALGPSYGLYSVLDFIVDNILPIVRNFREQLQDLEDDIFQDTFKRQTIRSLYELKKELVSLRLAVAPLQDMLNQLVRLYPGLIRDEVRPYFRDVSDHAIRINESIDTMREMLSAAISINAAVVGASQNEVVKRLAGWAALLAAPTLMTSWYGMNFHQMPELDKPWGYPAMIALTVSICGGLFLLLRRARWL